MIQTVVKRDGRIVGFNEQSKSLTTSHIAARAR